MLSQGEVYGSPALHNSCRRQVGSRPTLGKPLAAQGGEQVSPLVVDLRQPHLATSVGSRFHYHQQVEDFIWPEPFFSRYT